MSEPREVVIDGVRYVPARDAVAGLSDLRRALEDVFWGEGYKSDEERADYSLWIRVHDDGDGTPLNRFIDEIAARLSRRTTDAG